MRSLLLLLLAVPALAAGPLVVIDPGHGGEQTGATGPEGLIEKNLALAISRKVMPSSRKSCRPRWC